MGMDVYGKNPTSEVGTYFRNNVWWWRPLWDYCLEQHHVARKVEHGHSNDGDGLDAEDAAYLGRLLLSDVETGRAAQYEERYNYTIAAMPLKPCEYCDGTGIRSDEVGVNFGMPDEELPEADAILLGRTYGTCNGCSGHGKVTQFAANYPFSVDNVKEFATFLIDSGGFSIC